MDKINDLTRNYYVAYLKKFYQKIYYKLIQLDTSMYSDISDAAIRQRDTDLDQNYIWFSKLLNKPTYINNINITHKYNKLCSRHNINRIDVIKFLVKQGADITENESMNELLSFRQKHITKLAEYIIMHAKDKVCKYYMGRAIDNRSDILIKFYLDCLQNNQVLVFDKYNTDVELQYATRNNDLDLVMFLCNCSGYNIYRFGLRPEQLLLPQLYDLDTDKIDITAIDNAIKNNNFTMYRIILQTCSFNAELVKEILKSVLSITNVEYLDYFIKNSLVNFVSPATNMLDSYFLSLNQSSLNQSIDYSYSCIYTKDNIIIFRYILDYFNKCNYKYNLDVYLNNSIIHSSMTILQYILSFYDIDKSLIIRILDASSVNSKLIKYILDTYFELIDIDLITPYINKMLQNYHISINDVMYILNLFNISLSIEHLYLVLNYISYPDIEKVSYIINNITDIIIDDKILIPLFAYDYGALNDPSQLINDLLFGDYKIDIKNSDVLVYAVMSKWVNIGHIRRMVRLGADIHAHDDVIIVNCIHDNYDPKIIKYLLSRRVNINAHNSMALQVSQLRKYDYCKQFLIKQGAQMTSM